MESDEPSNLDVIVSDLLRIDDGSDATLPDITSNSSSWWPARLHWFGSRSEAGNVAEDEIGLPAVNADELVAELSSILALEGSGP